MVRRAVRDIRRRSTGRKRLGRGIFLCAVQYQKDPIAARHHTHTPTPTPTRYTHTHTRTHADANTEWGEEASRRDLAKPKPTAYVSIRTLGVTGLE